MTSQLPSVGTLVIGGGPAGLAPLMAASRGLQLNALLADGLAVVEHGSRIGAGRLGRYLINSDSAAETFLSVVSDHPDAGIAALADHPLGRALAEQGREPVPLRLVGAFLELLGAEMVRLLRERPGGLVLQRHSAVRLRRQRDGRWRAHLLNRETGGPIEIVARNVLLAMGGKPAAPQQTRFAGLDLTTLGNRLVHSDRVLDTDGFATIERQLAAGRRRPRVVVLGGSTSAISTVRLLLDRLGGLLDPEALTLMHRHPLKPWYRTTADAEADGYDDFGPDDLCPLSAMVNRFGGLRFGSGEIVRAALGLGGRTLDARVKLHPLAVDGTADRLDTRRLLRQADLVISALGYRPRLLPIFDCNGVRLALQADQADGSLVGTDAAVMDAGGKPIRGLFGIGLAAGFRPDPAMGGEPSFKGQVNGLWLWQNDVGRLIADRLLAPTIPAYGDDSGPMHTPVAA